VCVSVIFISKINLLIVAWITFWKIKDI